MSQLANLGSAWRPRFQEAAEEVMRDRTIYVTKDDLELFKTADSDIWEPSAEILEISPDLGKIEVKLVDKQMSLQKLNDHFYDQKLLGLVLLGEVISRKKEALLIIVTTDKTLYVFDPRYERAMRFLKLKLHDKALTFYTTNGLEEADCLYHTYGIDLSSEQATKIKCCTGMNVHLMKLLRSYPYPLKDTYSFIAQERSSRLIKVEKFEELVEMWLDIFKKDIRFDKEQLVHLNTRPLSMTANNIIRKRCVLVLPLAMKMEEISLLEAQVMSRNTFDILLSCSLKDKSLRKIMINGIKRERDKNNGAHVGYYNHLDIMYRDFANIYIKPKRNEQTSLVCK